MFRVQIIWNREFHYVNRDPLQDTVEKAVELAKMYKNMSDGEAVKSAQVVNEETGEVIVPDYKISY